MIVQSQLAAIDFNLESDLEQKTTKMGKECFHTALSNITNLSKLLKIEKNFMVTRSVEVVKMGLNLERVMLPVLPQNTASKPKPEKEEIISKQKAQFSKM